MRPQNQTLLALLVALVMSIGFVGVYALSYEYEVNQTQLSEVVWTTDSNAVFSEMDTSVSVPAMAGIQPYTLGSYKTTSAGTIWDKNNATGVYLGNDTWGASMIGWASETPLYSSALYMIPFDVPEAKTFIADTITINITLPADITLQIYAGGYNTPVDSTLITPGVQLANVITTTETSYDEEITLSSYQKLQWYSASTQYETPDIVIYIYDTDRDGLSSYAMEVSIVIEGQSSTTWSLQDSVNVAIGGSIAINVLVMVYMSDSIDLGGSHKDLPSKGRSKGKKGRGAKALKRLKEEFK